MTHKAKIDWWIAAALLLGIVSPLAEGDLWITIPMFLAVGICGYPQFYKTSGKGLMIQTGLIRRFIPYEAITFAGLDEEGGFERVRIEYGRGSISIVPVDCHAFLADVARRAPQLAYA